jgi:short-subunit dehydrogenase
MKKAIVLGATSGIGRALAEVLVGEGYVVGITGRRGELLDEMTAVNSAFIARKFDISDTGTTVAVLEELVAELGGLDLLVVSSGTGWSCKVLDFNATEQPTILTNVIGFTNVIDWAFNYFLEHGGGHLVGVSSILGMRGQRDAPAYCATKAYQISYMQSLRQRAAHLKAPITVTDIRPGFVDTAMGQSPKRFWVSSPEKAATQIFQAIRRRRRVVYITRRWRLPAMALRIIPDFIYNRM